MNAQWNTIQNEYLPELSMLHYRYDDQHISEYGWYYYETNHEALKNSKHAFRPIGSVIVSIVRYGIRLI